MEAAEAEKALRDYRQLEETHTVPCGDFLGRQKHDLQLFDDVDIGYRFVVFESVLLPFSAEWDGDGNPFDIRPNERWVRATGRGSTSVEGVVAMVGYKGARVLNRPACMSLFFFVLLDPQCTSRRQPRSCLRLFCTRKTTSRLLGCS